MFNEERSLPGCVEVLRKYLAESFPFDWLITVVDNASTDGTLRFTFGRRQVPLRRVHVLGLVVFVLYYLVTSGGLALLHAMAADPSRWWEAGVLVVSSVVGTALRFVLLRIWVFEAGARGSALRPAAPGARVPTGPLHHYDRSEYTRLPNARSDT